jgi:hypothetical protein
MGTDILGYPNYIKERMGMNTIVEEETPTKSGEKIIAAKCRPITAEACPNARPNMHHQFVT